MPNTSASRGRFISFEGGDGSGKSTQIRMLAETLRATGREVITTREPGGSAGADAIRQLLLEGPSDRWSPLTEALLMYASRADHLERTILPGLARGSVVISDRFSDSTMAYQGLAGALGESTVSALHSIVVGDNMPDLTIILDIPVAIGLQRAGNRGGEQRFESKGATFQQNVREAFLDIARREPDRCAIISAEGDETEVAARIMAEVRKRLPDIA